MQSEKPITAYAKAYSDFCKDSKDKIAAAVPEGGNKKSASSTLFKAVWNSAEFMDKRKVYEAVHDSDMLVFNNKWGSAVPKKSGDAAPRGKYAKALVFDTKTAPTVVVINKQMFLQDSAGNLQRLVGNIFKSTDDVVAYQNDDTHGPVSGYSMWASDKAKAAAAGVEWEFGDKKWTALTEDEQARYKARAVEANETNKTNKTNKKRKMSASSEGTSDEDVSEPTSGAGASEGGEGEVFDLAE